MAAIESVAYDDTYLQKVGTCCGVSALGRRSALLVAASMASCRSHPRNLVVLLSDGHCVSMAV